MSVISVKSKLANGVDKIAIVGNVLGANDGVVVPTSVLVEVAKKYGPIVCVKASGTVSVGAVLCATGTGLAFVACKSIECSGSVASDPDATESNEVPVS